MTTQELTKRQQAYVKAVELSTNGVEGVSSGTCPGCEQCAEIYDMSLSELEIAWQSGKVCDEGSFSHSGCGICGSPLGGNRYAWHFVYRNEIHHEEDMCEDCLYYLANGDVPADEYLDWLD
jgi:hypothetical protein